MEETPNQKAMRERHEKDHAQFMRLRNAVDKFSSVDDMTQLVCAVRNLGAVAACLMDDIMAEQQASFESRYKFRG